MRARSLRLLVFAALLAIACGGPPPFEPADPSRPVVVNDGRGTWGIEWPGNLAQYPVHAGRSPDEIDHTHLIATLDGPFVAIEDLDLGERPYFEITTTDGSWIVTERRIDMDGAHNFRDLGGYETTDGRHVRWGMVYRSDALDELSDEDLERMRRLGIRLVCDFRGPSEREAAPDRLPGIDPPQVALLEIHDESVDVAAIEETIRAGDFEGVDFAKLLIEGNRSFVVNFADRYAEMFDRMLEPDGLPALVHCTGGKDRAGLASALILLALGVPEETVFDDFLLTNVYTADRIERTIWIIRLMSFFQTDAEAVRPLLGVRREYLQAALDAMDERYGGVDGFLREGLGLDDEKRARLQALLLH